MLWWFYSFETQSQSRIPPVRSYRWKNCVLGAFPVLVSEVTASSDSTVNRSVYKLSRKASLLIKTRIDSEAVDGLMAAVLFDLDAKEMNPQTRFNKKNNLKKKPKTQQKKGGKSTLTLSYVCYSTWTKRQFYKPMAIKILAKFHSARS